MRYLLLIFFLFVSILASSCQSTRSTKTTNQQPMAPLTSAPAQPISAGWILGDNLTIVQDDWSLAIHVVRIEPNNVTLIVSTNGKRFDELQAAHNIRLLDGGGTEYKPSEIITLSDRDGFQVGALRFAGAGSNIQELNLAVDTKNSQTNQISVIKSDGSSLRHTGGTFTAFRQGYIEQNGNRISNNGAAVSGDLVASSESAKGMTTDELLQHTATETAKRLNESVTPTPASNTLALDVSGGEPIVQQFALRVENNDRKQIYYVYIVVTEEGAIRAKIVE